MKYILNFFLIFLIVNTLGVLMGTEHISLITSPILLYQDNIPISQGTGFFYVKQGTENNVLFLVTNYHVLTGSAPSENKPPIGNIIEFFIHKDNQNPQDVKSIKFPLYTKSGKRTWIASNKHKNADIAVIPILPNFYYDCKVNAVSDSWAEKKMKIRPTTQVTLVGYPHGYYDQHNQLPVWKTGHIASEPTFNFQNEPLILVDVSAFPGMSGAPVFSFAESGYEMEQGGFSLGGRIQQLIGIYASQPMLSENKYLEILNADSKPGITIEKSLNLGHIWKAELIVEMIQDFNVKEYEQEVLKDLR